MEQKISSLEAAIQMVNREARIRRDQITDILIGSPISHEKIAVIHNLLNWYVDNLERRGENILRLCRSIDSYTEDRIKE